MSETEQKKTETEYLLVGVDVGSTTTKIVAVAPSALQIVYSEYRRHNAAQVKSVYHALERLHGQFPDKGIRLALTGSGARPVAVRLNVPFIQEVVANSIALKEQYEDVGTAIELGGQDAKMIFFHRDSQTGELNVADMRMNGSCAGGTGAFIDEVASILKVPIEEFNALAAQGTCVYDISGRCGVYAKTDIQPLLNQGIAKADLALSAFHAIAKQTIGGLAQGLDIQKPVAFEGGPLTFNPVLIQVFQERLELSREDLLIPEHPEIMIAYGAALSLTGMFAQQDTVYRAEELMERLVLRTSKPGETGESETIAYLEEHPASAAGQPFFQSREEFEAFEARHRLPSFEPKQPQPGEVVRAYLGIDSGSTTTKFVLLDEDETLLDSFYAPNEGDPLMVAKAALLKLRDRYRKAGARLEIIAAGTTGYGELLFAKAFHADCHVVETVAHSRAAARYVEDATFILDIGGQDMKAIWIDQGIITNIVVNEACSSGCGSFLENFASTLNIPVKEIANCAFASEAPAVLGSRCTVFMNSSIITEQRNGKQSGDIMAGLCRSIIENVFTKVIRISNLESLGNKIVVQGGTFQNDAVLRAMEQYIGKEVVRAPYPGIMGAIGAALITKERFGDRAGAPHIDGAEQSLDGKRSFRSTFPGLDALETFSYRQESNSPCPFCANHCKRTIVTFSNGESWITNNRCERGEILGDPKEERVRALLKEKNQKKEQVANLFQVREDLLFKEYPYPEPAEQRACVIGIPRVLSYWETMPFWTTFWKALGYQVKISPKSTRKIYENGLSAVTSDTVCFPAKLVHGHIRSLAKAGVDRIFMPSITTVASENTEKTSESMCAVVKGYPIVVRNSDNPVKRWGISYDAPLFHWYTAEDRNRQLTHYMEETFGISREETLKAIGAADAAQDSFHRELKAAGQQVMDQVRAKGTYAVVLASRPYQNDALVNHDLPAMFTGMGIPVLTADSLPDADKVDLHNCRIDVVNNYHARMLSSAVLAAQQDCLEYVQIVSFGCGHDAYLSDEIIRIMKEISGKIPLVLKLDESDIQGPLRIRVRSFVETVAMRRDELKNNQRMHEGWSEAAAAAEQKNSQRVQESRSEAAAAAEQKNSQRVQKGWNEAAQQKNCQRVQEGRSEAAAAAPHAVRPLGDPYPVKFTKDCVKEKLVLVPNTSHAFCRIMSAALHTQHIRAVPLEIGREEAINLGKQYVHNDICFPAQIVIGEALAALRSGKYDDRECAIAMAKYIGDCRLTHYGALLRKALDDAGYSHVPILTNDDADYHNMHPGFKMNLLSSVRFAMALPMIDVLEELLRKIRPYELEAGSADRAFEQGMDALVEGLEEHGIQGARRGFRKAIRLMKQVAYDRSHLRPRVLIVGEYLLNFHPGANREIEKYLENNGFEIIEARMTDVIRKTYFYQDAQIREYHLKKPFAKKAMLRVTNDFFEMGHNLTDSIAKEHPLYERACRMEDLVKDSDPIIHHTFDAGEGVLIPAEILHHAREGCRAFVILQPFGCLPNHVVGRGISKRLKELYPDAQILPLDYDPDVSFANIENRLQMLIMNAKLTT